VQTTECFFLFRTRHISKEQRAFLSSHTVIPRLLVPNEAHKSPASSILPYFSYIYASSDLHSFTSISTAATLHFRTSRAETSAGLTAGDKHHCSVSNGDVHYGGLIIGVSCQPARPYDRGAAENAGQAASPLPAPMCVCEAFLRG
jgi:hypothetical protein